MYFRTDIYRNKNELKKINYIYIIFIWRFYIWSVWNFLFGDNNRKLENTKICQVEAKTKATNSLNT